MISREQTLTIINRVGNEYDAMIIGGNGYQARFLHSTNDRKQNFYMLGSMGLASSIGLGLAISKPNKKVIVVEGDGNNLMGQGAQATIGLLSPKNFIHIVLNNEKYETTGGQPTASPAVNFTQVALGNGYKSSVVVNTIEELENALTEKEGPVFIEVKLFSDGNVVPRVPYHPIEIKERFQEAIS